MSPDEYSENVLRTLRELIPSFEVHRQSSVLVGDRKAMIQVATYDVSDLGLGTGTFGSNQLLIVDGKVAWSVVCGSVVEDYEQHAETWDAVVRSFRILE